MTDYTKLVAALRYCAEQGDFHCGKDCPMYDSYPTCLTKMDTDAADAIEALQAQLPKRGEWVEENRRPRSMQFVCSACKRTAYDPQPTRDKAWNKRCRYAFCPNCGADMRKKMEVQDADT